MLRRARGALRQEVCTALPVKKARGRSRGEQVREAIDLDLSSIGCLPNHTSGGREQSALAAEQDLTHARRAWRGFECPEPLRGPGAFRNFGTRRVGCVHIGSACALNRDRVKRPRGSLQDGDETRQAWDTRQARVRQKQPGSRGGGRHCDADRDRCLERGPVHASCREERTSLSSHDSGHLRQNLRTALRTQRAVLDTSGVLSAGSQHAEDADRPKSTPGARGPGGLVTSSNVPRRDSRGLAKPVQ
jgi:hypothetical protein